MKRVVVALLLGAVVVLSGCELEKNETTNITIQNADGKIVVVDANGEEIVDDADQKQKEEVKE